jgi:sugar/nucleoside kinase (ribokinase family)
MQLNKKTDFDVLVIGTTCVDLVFSEMPNWPKNGEHIAVKQFAIQAGANFNIAATLSKLGLRVALLTVLGNDFTSHFVRGEMAKNGISNDFVIEIDQPIRAISTCLAHEGERGIVSYEDVEDATFTYLLSSLTSDDPYAQQIKKKLYTLLNEYRFSAIYISGKATIEPLAALLAEQQATIFMDPEGTLENLSHPHLASALQQAHFIMPNQREAQMITQCENPSDAARKLSEWVQCAIVTVGEHGAIASCDGELYQCPAHPVKVVDTTGAGDAFCGGFIYAWTKGYSLPDALRYGTVCGSLSTTALGGNAAVPTGQQLEAYIAQSSV